jgi:hypothetical protein
MALSRKVMRAIYVCGTVGKASGTIPCIYWEILWILHCCKTVP